MAKQSDSHKKEESELIEKVLYINRCSKVVKGGRKFSFSALILVGDKKGRVGFGFAKANELTDAIRKAGEAGRKDLFYVTMDGKSIPHEIEVKWDGARVLLKPAKEGTGIIAGSKMRDILKLAGYEDIVTKSLGSNNPLNIVLATMNALKQMDTIKNIKARRGVQV